MDDLSLQELVRELRAIRIREAEILERLETIPTEAPSQETKKTTAAPTKVSSHGLKIGDRITIVNKVLKKPANWPRSDQWIEEDHKTATIQEIIQITPSNTQVHFITDGGIQTWRAPNNVRVLK